MESVGNVRSHRASTKWLPVLIAAVLLGVGMVTGCGSQSAEPEPKESSEGDDHQKQNEQKQTGNEQPDKPEPEEFTFVKQYIEAMNTAMKTGDGTEVRELGTEDCDACNTFADFQEDLYEDGGEYLGDPSYTDLELVEGPEKGDDGRTWLRVSKFVPEVEQRKEKGAQPITLEGRQEFTDFGLIKEEGTWKAAAWCGVTEGQPVLACLGQ